MSEPLIQFHNVSYTYAGEGEPQPAVRALSFALGRGEFVAMVGHNGSGKSTAAKLCNGLLLPGEGKVVVDGHDTADAENLFEIRRRVGMVFQNPDNQIIAAIVEDDVAFGPENLCLPPAEIRLRVDDALREVGNNPLSPRKKRFAIGTNPEKHLATHLSALIPQYLGRSIPVAAD